MIDPKESPLIADNKDIGTIVDAAVFGYRIGEEFPVSVTIPHSQGWRARLSTRVANDGSGRIAALELVDDTPLDAPSDTRYWKVNEWIVDGALRFKEHVRGSVRRALTAHIVACMQNKPEIARAWAERIRRSQ